MLKALSISSFIPTVSSETKVKINQPRYRRATVMPRSAAQSTTRTSRANWVPYLSAAGLALAVIALGFHLYMVNAYAVKGYDLQRHQQAIRELSDQQKLLLVQQSELGSFSKVNDVASGSGLVPVTNEEFITTNQISKR